MQSPLKQSLAIVVAFLSLVSVGLQLAFAQTAERGADERVAIDGLPKIPASLVSEVRPYTKLSAYLLAGWHPSKQELWVKSLTSVYSSVYTVTSPGDAPQVHTVIPTDVYDVYYQPQGTSLVYVKDTNGNEVFQLYAYDFARRRNTLVSDGKSRNTILLIRAAHASWPRIRVI